MSGQDVCIYLDIPLKKQLFLAMIVIHEMNNVYTVFVINLML